jgi:2-oxoglutarate dehydrogenase E2 component (dihydrolipoamide succinyltransferase)
VGESITEGVVSQWLKKDGDLVREGEPLFELETEKASQEIPAPATGVLHISVAASATVSIGQQVGRIEPDEKPAARKAPEPPRDGVQAKAPPAAVPVAVAPAPFPQPAAVGDLQPAAPSVRRLAAEQGVDVNQVPGTGRSGRITKEDVLHFVEQRKPEPPPAPRPEPLPAPAVGPPPRRTPAPPPAPAPAGTETRQRMSAIRQRIAERLVASQQTTATLTTFNEVDLAAVMELRSRYKDRFKDKHGVALGFMSFFVKACVEALRAFPQVNGRIEGNEIVLPGDYHIGVAVSTERGLMVPVIRHADRLSFAAIEQTIAEMASRARESKITVDDLQGGTFSITNGGIFGSLLSTPILNPPQSGILGMHAIQKRPVVVNDQIVIRPMMYLALSYDHRLIDGREAVQFLVRVKECVEDPERMLLEI